MTPMELEEFVAARLDEDDAAALANIGAGPGFRRGLGDDERGPGPSWPDYQTYDSPDLEAAEEYINRFRPLRMLREAGAKRARLTRYERLCRPRTLAERATFPALREMVLAGIRDDAAIWQDHPDYREEWRP